MHSFDMFELSLVANFDGCTGFFLRHTCVCCAGLCVSWNLSQHALGVSGVQPGHWALLIWVVSTFALKCLGSVLFHFISPIVLFFSVTTPLSALLPSVVSSSVFLLFLIYSLLSFPFTPFSFLHFFQFSFPPFLSCSLLRIICLIASLLPPFPSVLCCFLLSFPHSCPLLYLPCFYPLFSAPSLSFCPLFLPAFFPFLLPPKLKVQAVHPTVRLNFTLLLGKYVLLWILQYILLLILKQIKK